MKEIKKKQIWFRKENPSGEDWVVKVIDVQENKIVFKVIQHEGKSVELSVALETDKETFLEYYE